jgi:uncharacterized protein YukE
MPPRLGGSWQRWGTDMTITYQMCSQLETDALQIANCTYPQASLASQNASKAIDDASLWSKFSNWLTGWMNDLVKTFKEWLESFQKAMGSLADWVRSEVLPWIFSPFALMSASGDYHEIAVSVSSIAGRMAKGQIQPGAGWKGVGADAYETTRGQQQEGAIASSSIAQGLSETLARVARTMFQTGLDITVLILKTVADVWKEIGYLADIKRWTEVIGQTNAAMVAIGKGMLDLAKELVAYVTSGVPEVKGLEREGLKGTSLAGGQGWPMPSPTMTQPNVNGEPASWGAVT